MINRNIVLSNVVVVSFLKKKPYWTPAPLPTLSGSTAQIKTAGHFQGEKLVSLSPGDAKPLDEAVDEVYTEDLITFTEKDFFKSENIGWFLCDVRRSFSQLIFFSLSSYW